MTAAFDAPHLRTDPRFAGLYPSVPDGADAARAWEAAGAPLVAEYKRLNNGKLADYAVSHAGETSFPRSFQLLAEGGKNQIILSPCGKVATTFEDNGE